MIEVYKKILLHKNQTIKDALIAINSEPSLKIGLVVDGSNTLEGVVTDGDIRRGLLAKYTLETPVFEIMNVSPITSTVDASKEYLIRMMGEKGIFAIPIVKDNVLVGLETYNEVLAPVSYENPVFLMAGGFGTRLRPLTDNCPKPLLEIGGRPLLETVLISFKEAGFSNFYISTHYLSSMIMAYFGDGSKWGVTISYVHEDVPLGTGGALGLLPEGLPNLPIILMNGDVLTTVNFQNLLEFHNQNNAMATMCVREYEYQVPYGVITGDGHKVRSMEEKPLHSFFVNAGIYVVDSEVVMSVVQDEHLDMPTLLEQRIKQGDDVLMFPIHEYWLDIGRIDDFKKAQNDFSSLGFK